MLPFRATTAIAAACLVLSVGGSARASTISLAWDPVDHPSLAGYRVYFDTVPDAYSSSLDVGPSTAVTLSGLADCTSYQVAVKAYDGEGNESAAFSTPVTGWPRPIVTSVMPATVEQQSQATLTVDGANFMQGASLIFDDPAVAVDAVSWTSCQRLVIEVSVGAAALGALALRVVNPDGVFGDGAGLVAVGSDATAPTLAAVSATAVTATTATIAWTTGEAADGRVFFRREDQSAWQLSPLATPLTTLHSITIAGLWPETSYEFYVESSDAAGNSAASSPGGFVTGASPHSYLRFEAESGQLEGPIVAGTGGGSFADAWIEVAAGTTPGVLTDPAGTATFGVWLPAGGDWTFWVRIRGASAQSDSWFASVDDETTAEIHAPGPGAWHWIEASAHALDAGQHTFTLGGRDPLARVDRVLVTDDAGYVPSEEPGDDVALPLAVVELVAVAASGQVALGWDQPSDPDAVRLVVRFRTDGVAPTSPVDGHPLLDVAAPAAGAASHVHAGLTDGVTYGYALFVIDAAGNASEPATVQATPAPDPPPAVENVRRTDTL
jgi:hypothetical protein